MTVEVEAWTPACMTPDELAAWSTANASITSLSNRARRPCVDCTLGYAAEMRVAGSCNGTPGGVEEDDVMTDEPPLPEPTLASAERLRRVELEVVAPPCESCLHEPVCALRQALEAIASVETTAPPLRDGLRLSLAATIACDHYARSRAKPGPAKVLTSEQRGAAARIAGQRHHSPEGLERLRESGRIHGRKAHAARVET